MSLVAIDTRAPGRRDSDALLRCSGLRGPRHVESIRGPLFRRVSEGDADMLSDSRPKIRTAQGEDIMTRPSLRTTAYWVTTMLGPASFVIGGFLGHHP